MSTTEGSLARSSEISTLHAHRGQQHDERFGCTAASKRQCRPETTERRCCVRRVLFAEKHTAVHMAKQVYPPAATATAATAGVDTGAAADAYGVMYVLCRVPSFVFSRGEGGTFLAAPSPWSGVLRSV